MKLAGFWPENLIRNMSYCYGSSLAKVLTGMLVQWFIGMIYILS